MKKTLSLIVAFCILITSVMPIPAAGDTTDIYEQIRTSAAEKAQLLTTTYGAVSVQYALVEAGELKVSGQSGVYAKDENTALTSDSMYGIGSTSKMFVTAAAMKLVQEKSLDLDKPVVDYIPEFTMADDRYKQITPRMLLNHSSGLYGSTFVNGFLYDDSDTYLHDTFLEKLSVQRLKADPGEFSVYCNDGFTLAEILIERISGKDFTDYIHENFTGPLNMSNTKTPNDEFDRNSLVRTYDAYTGRKTPVDTLNVIGTGGIYSTAEDMCKFADIFTGRSDILSDESIAATMAPEYDRGIWSGEGDSAVNYGLGWDSVELYPFTEYGIKAAVKGGDTQLYHATLVVLPEYDLAVSVLSSGGMSTYNQLMAVDMLLDVLEAKGEIEGSRPNKSNELPKENYTMPEADEKYLGNYIGTMQFIKMSKGVDGVLNVSNVMIPGSGTVAFRYDGDGYISEYGNEKIKFVEEENGHTYIWSQNYSGLPEFTQTASSVYVVQQAKPYEVPESAIAAWQQRTGKSFVMVSDKYTSQIYGSLIPAVGIMPYDGMNGYLGSAVMSEPDKAVNIVQVPGAGGRDASDYEFYTVDGVEYMDTRGYIYQDLASFVPLYGGDGSICTIQDTGYARWYTVPAEAAGKTLTADIAGNGSYGVYDANGICIYFSVMGGEGETTLPENGYIVFIGEAGTVFDINLK